MKICYDARAILNQKTGLGNYAFSLLKSLLAIDKDNLYKVLVYDGLDNNHPIYQLNQANLIVESVNIPPVSISQQLLIPKLLKKEKPDIYHYPNWDVPVFQNVNTVFTIHDLTYLLHKNVYVKYNILKRLYTYFNIFGGVKKAKKIIVVSQNTKKDLKNLFRVPERKINVVYEAFESQFTQKVSEEKKDRVLKSFNIFGRYFLFVGERRPHKNLPLIIKAFHKFDQINSNYNLVIVGKPYADYNEDVNVVKQLNLEEKVKFLNYVDNEYVHVFYQSAEALIFVSLYEGFGIPILEAMSSGTPVITSNVSSMPEIAGEAAIRVDPFSSDEISMAMIKIVNESQLRKDLVEKGYQRVKQFSWEKTAQETLKIYQSVLG